MGWGGRKPGISVLLSSQDEEVCIGWSIRSFLPFADEIIVVDNGSTDATKEIAGAFARAFPDQVQFYDRPDIVHLYDNRQFALSKSSYYWIVRADSDYICDTRRDSSGWRLRQELLRLGRPFKPHVIKLRHPNLAGDFWHTPTAEAGVLSNYSARVYSWYPGMQFQRHGRWEGVRHGRLWQKLVRTIEWSDPVWMHCTIKSALNLFFRSERTNWREQGDFNQYPTLQSWIESRMHENGVEDMAAAAEEYMLESLKDLSPYNPDICSYPPLVSQAMELDPVYQIRNSGGRISGRHHRGLNMRAIEELGPQDLEWLSH